MNFKKIALAAAIASVPVVGFSVESLEDADLGTVTGQDGIQVEIAIGASGISADIYLHDTDGLNGGVGYTSYSFDGAIVIQGMTIGGAGSLITLEIDAGDNAVSGGAPVLNINVALPSSLTIATGAISVANSRIDDTPSNRGVLAQTSTILSNMTIILGGASLNIQLGNEQQVGASAGTDMIVFDAAITGGVSISNFALNDVGSGGAIGMTSMTITDSATTDLTVAADINVTTAGLVIDLANIGDGGGLKLEIVDQYLGTTTAGIIGDVSVRNLNLNGTTITISGK